MFSDETPSCVGKRQELYVWRKKGEKCAASCRGSHCDPLRVQASVVFWGCVSYYGVGTLVPVELEENLNSQKYVEVLESNMWPFIAKDFVDRPWILKSRLIMQWKRQNRIPCMIWPSQSPDINNNNNIIENGWPKLKSSLKRRAHEISTLTRRSNPCCI